MQVLAAQSQREVVRSRHRTMAAMTAQTIEQGRYMGGRPPYGYRLVDAGPHPNQAHAAGGRRCRRLDPDPDTAARAVDVRRAPRRAQRGRDRARVERARCAVPVGYRPGAESAPRRAGVEPAVGDSDPGQPALHGTSGVEPTTQRARPGPGRSTVAGEWAVSRTRSHPALVSDADFIAVQQCRATRKCADGVTRDYVLAGLVQCRACGRRMDSHWVRVAPDTGAVTVTTAPGPDRRTRRATSTSARTCSWCGSPRTSRPIGADPAALSSRAPPKKSSPGCGPSRR